MANTALNGAKKAKQDEFYTRLVDIEKEMNAYIDYDKDVFRGKTILLPCDDPTKSKFTHFFATNFHHLGIKKLISTCYAGKEGDKGKKLCITANNVDTDGVVDFNPQNFEWLEGNGDFRSEEITNLRNEADMVITNPPFSLFREFVTWLKEGNVDFSVIGNINAVTYREVFPLIKENNAWIGTKKMTVDGLFTVPKDIEQDMLDNSKPGGRYRIVDGKVLGRAATIWFTTLQHGKRHEPLELHTMKDNRDNNTQLKKKKHVYDTYDNYDAIEVPLVNAIPSDYYGPMGVPISFLDKYCPEQFYIVDTKNTPVLGGEKIYKRIIIRRRT